MRSHSPVAMVGSAVRSTWPGYSRPRLTSPQSAMNRAGPWPITQPVAHVHVTVWVAVGGAAGSTLSSPRSRTGSPPTFGCQGYLGEAPRARGPGTGTKIRHGLVSIIVRVSANRGCRSQGCRSRQHGCPRSDAPAGLPCDDLEYDAWITMNILGYPQRRCNRTRVIRSGGVCLSGQRPGEWDEGSWAWRSVPRCGGGG